MAKNKLVKPPTLTHSFVWHRDLMGWPWMFYEMTRFNGTDQKNLDVIDRMNMHWQRYKVLTVDEQLELNAIWSETVIPRRHRRVQKL